MTLSTRKSILDIPEVIKLIDSFQEPCDCASLARASRQLFQKVMPLLWERLDGLSWILPLLPGLDDIKQGKGGNKSLTESDFVRFNVYAPWIKHIKVYEGRKSPLEKSQLDALCIYSANRTLLPNLSSLTLADVGEFTDISWAILFMSPSLQNLEFETNGPFETFRSLNVSEWPILLHHLAEKCPKLQTLSAFPRHFKNSLDPRVGLHISNDIKAKINSQRELGLGPFFANLCPLVSLTSSGEILDDACFSAIGTWPALESLTIRMNPKIRDYTIPTLDNTAFPALTTLILHWIPNFNVFRMFWDTPALVSKLTTVKLLPSTELSYYTNEEISDTVSQILSMLAEKSPRLENIWLRMLHPDAGRPYNEIPRSILDVLHKLPLRSIHLDGVVLLDPETSGPKETHKNLDLVTYFAKMFPDLKQLGFPLHPVRLSILRDFHSKFPQLESLCFDFDLSALSLDLKVDTANIPRYRSSPFFMLEANFLGLSDEGFAPSIKRFSYEDAMLFVTYVFSLWPDTQIAAQMEEDDCDGDRTVHHNMIELINIHLANLSWWNCDASVEYKDVKVLNEESWARCKVNNRDPQDGDSGSE